ncbi:MAG TPA: hypothetical protein VG937_15465 [Polyangiaceae bacterium]|nr:hypothetical protein [Polyangiaceae bacterium]
MTRIAAALLGFSLTLFAVSEARADDAVVVERSIARFWAPDTGGVQSPHFIYEHVLAFEARVEALADPNRGAGSEPFRSRHVNDALERHVAETLLAGLHIDPEPDEAALLRQVQSARARLVERVGGEVPLQEAALAEGFGARDLLELLRRQARASLYLDRMVAPMLDPSEAELRALHRTRNNPFRELPFERIEPGLRRWYVGQRLAAAVQNFYQNARSRITLTALAELPGGAELER